MPPCGSQGRPRDRTSTPAAQANALTHHHPDCSEGRRRRAVRSPRGHEQHARTTDATGREPRVPRSYGRYLVALYNAERPHSSFGWQTPLVFAAAWERPCAQRDRTLSRSEGIAPGSVASDAQNTFNHPTTLVPRG